jgi:GH24 family phage-related lysozyme (muramidase)
MQENAWGVSPFTLNFIKKLEGYTPKPKWDYKQHSVGYGTRWEPGMPVGTQADHEAALGREAGKVKSWLDQNVKTPLTDNQRAALVSAGFNLGTGEKGIGRLLGDINSGNWDSVARRLPTFNKAGGEVNKGLINRRAAEVEMLTGRKPTLQDAMGSTGYIGGTGAAPSPGPAAMPVDQLVAPSGRYSKLADALMAQAASARPTGWGTALQALGSAALGHSLASKEDKAQQDYRSKLAQALGGASDTNLAQTMIASGDPDLMKSGVSLKVAQAKPKSEIGRYRPTKQGVVDTTTGQIVPGTEQMGADQAEYGTSPQYIRDKDGKLRIGQLSKAGGMKILDVDGEVLPGFEKIDTGTEFQFRDKRTNEIVGSQPKDIVGKESQEEVGKAQGQATVALPAAKTSLDNALATIGELRNHPGLDAATGLSNWTDPRAWTPGTDAYNFLEKNKQAAGQSFLMARDTLKGAGAVTDFEGIKGEQAIANLNAAQSKEQYLSALDTLERMMNKSYEDLQRKAGGSPAPASPEESLQSRKQKWGLE